jgi:cell division protein ZapA
MSESPEPASGPATVVTIFGRTYHLRGAEDPEYLERLAGVVDSKMREVWSSSGTADTLKIAILAALNLADESLEGRNRAAVDAEPRDHLERIANVIARLDGALGSAGPIPAQRD